MLPEGYHEEACKLLCTWLRRLEERDKLQHGNTTSNSTAQNQRNLDPGNTHKVTNAQAVSGVPSVQHTRTKR